jgi:hypothetical protein
MNERNRELWERACTRYSVYETLKPQDERKNIPDIFAELIIQECISTLEEKIYRSIDGDGDEIWVDLILKEHFGVEECK